jgi:hypothetical protein
MSGLLGVTTGLLGTATTATQGALLASRIGPLAAVTNKFMPPSTTNSIYQYLTTGGSRMKRFFSNDIPSLFQAPFSGWKALFWSLLFLGLILLFLWTKGIIFKAKVKSGFQDASLQTFHNILNTLRADDDPSPSINDKLLNLQLLTFKQAAFLGTEYNSFNINEAINGQLQLGSRAIFLQIDFVDRDRDGLCKKFEPCLYYKNENGTLLSSNSAKLSEVFQHIGETAFQPSIKNNESPLLLFLHFVNIPNPTEPNEYLSKVANALKVLKPNLLTGGFYRSEKEDDLFQLKFNEFGGKIIVGTNIRTSTLVKTDKNDDLDYMVNFHYYVPDNFKVDSTITAPYGSKINALIFDYNTIKNISPKDFTEKYSSYFTILKAPQESNIPEKQMKMYLEEYGINVITYEYFNDLDIGKNVRKFYKSGFSKRIQSLRY